MLAGRNWHNYTGPSQYTHFEERQRAIEAIHHVLPNCGWRMHVSGRGGFRTAAAIHQQKSSMICSRFPFQRPVLMRQSSTLRRLQTAADHLTIRQARQGSSISANSSSITPEGPRKGYRYRAKV